MQYGVIDGVYQGGAAILRIGGGFIGDRWRRHKDVAVAGYGISAGCKLALVAVGSTWSALTGIILLDRAGKGIRTAPRDAMISLSTPREQLGTAFGVHPPSIRPARCWALVAFGLLMLTPTAFDSVFFVSFCFALVGLGVLVFFVRSERDSSIRLPKPAPRGVGLFRVLGERRFAALTLVGSVLGLVTISDGFVYLGLQRRLDFEPGLFPLLFVATAAVYMLLAVPVGRLANRVGRTVVYLGGYGLLVPVYACLWFSGIGPAGVILCVALLGAFYAATDGVLAAMASAILPDEARGTGLAALLTATSTGRLVASVVFGTIWTGSGTDCGRRLRRSSSGRARVHGADPGAHPEDGPCLGDASFSSESCRGLSARGRCRRRPRGGPGASCPGRDRNRSSRRR